MHIFNPKWRRQTENDGTLQQLSRGLVFAATEHNEVIVKTR